MLNRILSKEVSVSAPDHSKISITAKLVAYFRQFSNIPFAEDVAEFIHAKEAFDGIIQSSDLNSTELLQYAPIFEARYQSIVKLLEQHQCDQVLELASGFSLRGLAMANKNGITYVETDLPGVNEEKRKLIDSVRKNHSLPDLPNHHIAIANALNLEDLGQAMRPLPKGKRLAIVNEGLIHYFSVEERETLAQNVRSILQEYTGGVWITPDFATKTDARDVPRVLERFREAIAGATDRQLYSSAFEKDEDREKFFAELGFNSVCHYQADLVQYISSVYKLKISPEIMQRLKRWMRIWVLSLPN